MNISQCQSLGSNSRTYNSLNIQYISSDILFKRSAFRNLTRAECIEKALKLGWKWDINREKYYRIGEYKLSLY